MQTRNQFRCEKRFKAVKIEIDRDMEQKSREINAALASSDLQTIMNICKNSCDPNTKKTPEKMSRYIIFAIFDMLNFLTKDPLKRAKRGHYLFTMIKSLTSVGVNPNDILFSSNSKCEDLPVAIYFGADVNAYNYGCPALIFAAGDIEKIEFLIKNGANPNCVDQIQGIGTFLHVFIANENFYKIEKVINLVKDKLELSLLDIEGKTTIILAAKVMDKNALNLLLEIDKKKQNSVVNFRDNLGRTALHYACVYGHITMVKYLIESGAKFDVEDNAGFTPIDYLYTTEEFLKNILLEIEIHPDRDINSIKNSICTNPANITVSRKCFENRNKLVELLKKNNIEGREYIKLRQPKPPCQITPIYSLINNPININRNIRVLAYYGKTYEIRNLVYIYGLNVNALQAKEPGVNKTALHHAVYFGKTSTVKFLLYQGVDRNIKDNEGKTPLDYCKDDKIKKLLLERDLSMPIFTRVNH